jgi:hypothetical protein
MAAVISASQVTGTRPAPPSITATTAPRSVNRVADVASSWPARVGSVLPLRTQTSLRVSSAGDPAEREAEATAKRVVQVREPASSPPTFTGGGSSVNRAPAAAQGKSGGDRAAAADIAQAIQGEMGSGSPLPTDVRTFMEPRFKADFSGVRIHTDAKAAGLAARLSARAFAFGRHIFFGRDQFHPESRDGAELLAHELTHTIQQQAVVQRQEQAPAIVERGGGVQRFGLSDVLDYFADKANIIPGYRMFTIVIGVNPINMSRVERNAANILRAIVEFIPGGGLFTQALDKYGVFDKVGAWVEQQIQALAGIYGAVKKALADFLDSLGWSDIFHLGSVWDRAKRIFTEPIDRIINFAKGLITGILGFIRDAILLPLAKLAEGTKGYDLLKAVLGKDPVTGETVPQTAETLIPGFLKLIGQEDVWENMKESNAIPRAWAWFQGAMKALLGFISQIPTLAINAVKSLEIMDIVILPRAIIKVAAVFGDFIVRFGTWAGTAVWNLLEIIFDAVSPGAFGYIKKTGAALRSILKNPLPFVGNLGKAAKGGFNKFKNRFGEHLKAGLIDWLLGSLPGLYIPKAFSLPEIVKFVFSVLGLTWANIRQKLVKVIGETAVKVLETGFDIVVTLVREGPAAAWEKIKDELATLKDKVIDGIIGMVVDAIVTKAIPKLIAMFIPGAGFISAIISIYDMVMVFVNKIKRIIDVVKGFLDSIIAIAAGKIDAAVDKVESILAGLLSLAINFLAGFAGLGKLADKVRGIIDKVQGVVDKGLDTLIGWIAKAGKAIFSKVKTAAGKLMEWWKLTKPVPGGGTVSTEGSETATKVMIAMSPGMRWSEFLGSVKVDASDSKQKAALVEAKRLATLAEQNRKPSVEPKDHAAAVEKALNDLAVQIGVLNGTAAAPASVITYSGTDSGGGGVTATANPLSKNHPPGTKPADEGKIWADLKDLGKGLGKDVRARFFVRGHLLNENLGGPGMLFNLTPITKKANNDHKTAVEKEMKDLVNVKGQVVSYTVKVLPSPPLGTNPRLAELQKKPKAGRTADEEAEIESLKALKRLTRGFVCTAKLLTYDPKTKKWSKENVFSSASLTIENNIEASGKTYGYD